MTADNQKLEVVLTQDLTTGEVSVKANQSVTFNIALHLYLVSLKGLKDVLLKRISDMSKDEIIKFAFGEAYQAKAKAALPEEAELKKAVCTKMEEDMYDMLNLGVSNFLDSEFPLVNEKLSLTEEAAAEAGLDRNATPEELVQAEMDFIEKHPEEAAQCSEMQPTAVKSIEGVH